MPSDLAQLLEFVRLQACDRDLPAAVHVPLSRPQCAASERFAVSAHGAISEASARAIATARRSIPSAIAKQNAPHRTAARMTRDQNMLLPPASSDAAAIRIRIRVRVRVGIRVRI